ncbi:hypothetical protein AMS68_003940 [Peltaster fructicola]|uniref:DNA-directed RNA polymerase III subunit RPC6 n=1 Tax=Peltaster fructicola TaxID=286661 RepID=A0A6H0XUL3_9PEZI|nr:hypothetical protein AMS68_003940 [Peltaster fructicola]
MAKLSAEADELYVKCMEVAATTADPSAREFTQVELEALTAWSSEVLLRLITELTDHLLMRSFKVSNQIHWCCRSKDLAASLSTLSEQERIVFGHIEDSNIVGVWVKRIKAITQIPPNEVQKAVGKLERMGLVKGIRSVNNLAQRLYMLAHLAPSEKVTGGSFYDNGVLDESMVEEMRNLIVFHVRTRSWIDARRKARQGSSTIDLEDDEHHDTSQSRKRKRAVESIEPGSESVNGKHKNEVFLDDSDSEDQAARQQIATGKKRKLDAGDIEDGGMPSKSRRREEARTYQLAYPHGYTNYPTVRSILEFLQGCEALRESKRQTLTVEEVQCLLNVLVWDDKLEKIRNGYRTVRGVEFSQPGASEFEPQNNLAGNGLTEVPCGRCQLFDLCQEGTKVSADSCVYYAEWIST